MKILGFSVEKYDKTFLDNLTEVQLNEFALSDDEYVQIYDDVCTFINELNDGLVDVTNNWFYPVNV